MKRSPAETPARTEAALERQVLRALGSDRQLAIFRNECGEGHHVRAAHAVLGMLRSRGLYEEASEAQDIYAKSRVHFGLHNGSADLIGVVALVVTPDMVGRTIGRFVSIELKSVDGTLRPEQRQWRDRMIELGAAAGVVRSPGNAALLIEEARGV